MKHMAILSLLLAIGCSSSGPESKRDASGPPVQPKLQLMIFFNDGPGLKAVSRQVEQFDDPSPESIEQKARALNWSDPKQVPLVNLGWAAKGPFGAFSITGLLGSANEDEAVHANWVSFEDGRGVLRRSRPLKTLDAAVELLLLAYKQDERKLKTIQEWKVIKPNP